MKSDATEVGKLLKVMQLAYPEPASHGRQVTPLTWLPTPFQPKTYPHGLGHWLPPICGCLTWWGWRQWPKPCRQNSQDTAVKGDPDLFSLQK